MRVILVVVVIVPVGNKVTPYFVGFTKAWMRTAWDLELVLLVDLYKEKNESMEAFCYLSLPGSQLDIHESVQAGRWMWSVWR